MPDKGVPRQFIWKRVTMRVALVSLESFYDHSLALDYLVAYGLARPELAGGLEFRVFVHREEDDRRDLIHRVLDWKPDVVGFNTYVWNIDASVAVARRIRSELRHAILVFGGMEATFNAPSLLLDVEDVDFVIIGEGEIAFCELLLGLHHGERFEQPRPGLAWRDSFGKPVMAGIGPALTDLDVLPSPFQEANFGKRGLRRVLYESYRGCAFRCDFCLYSREYAPKRYFSIERVKADLDCILASGASHIRFVDATFNLDRKRAKEILQHLSGCGADVCVEVSAEFFDAEMVNLFPKAGIRHVDIGLQSTQKDALKAINREWYREDKFRKNLALLREEQALTLNVELIAGLPEDSPAGLRTSLDEAVMTWPDHVSVYRLLGLKGTRLDREAAVKGLQFDPNPPYELIQSRSFSAEDLDRVNDLTFAHLVLFNLGVGRFALRYLVDVFRLRPTDIYDEFFEVVVTNAQYSREEARWLGRHHAYGNRFDQPMPQGLELDRVHSASFEYFKRAEVARLTDAERATVLELVDFGHRLAQLDSAREQVERGGANACGQLRLAPWCQVKSYRNTVISELARQGHGLGELEPSDVAALVFFYHPELGPAALAVDEDTAGFLNSVEADVESSEDVEALVNSLREMLILVGSDARVPVESVAGNK